MASNAQVSANTANSQQSTGPVTDSGKALSSQNARKHGFTAAELHIPEELREHFEEFQDGLVAIIDPTNDLERNLAKQLVAAAWRIERMRVAEAELIASDPNPFLNPAIIKGLDALQRYIAAAERSYQRALKELRELQTNRFLGRCEDVDPLLPCLTRLASAERIKRARASQFAHKTKISPKLRNEPKFQPVSHPTVPDFDPLAGGNLAAAA